jgi:hypothetical protein
MAFCRTAEDSDVPDRGMTFVARIGGRNRTAHAATTEGMRSARNPNCSYRIRKVVEYMLEAKLCTRSAHHILLIYTQLELRRRVHTERSSVMARLRTGTRLD